MKNELLLTRIFFALILGSLGLFVSIVVAGVQTHSLHSVQQSVQNHVGGQVLGVAHPALAPTLRTERPALGSRAGAGISTGGLGPVSRPHVLETGQAKCVLAGQHLVVGPQGLKAHGTLQESPDHFLRVHFAQKEHFRANGTWYNRMGKVFSLPSGISSKLETEPFFLLLSFSDCCHSSKLLDVGSKRRLRYQARLKHVSPISQIRLFKSWRNKRSGTWSHRGRIVLPALHPT